MTVSVSSELFESVPFQLAEFHFAEFCLSLALAYKTTPPIDLAAVCASGSSLWHYHQYFNSPNFNTNPKHL